MSSILAELDPNAPDFLDHFFQMARFPHLYRRVVKGVTHAGGLGQSDEHTCDVLGMYERQHGVGSKRNLNWVRPRRLEDSGAPRGGSLLNPRSNNPGDAQGHKLDRLRARESFSNQFDGPL